MTVAGLIEQLLEMPPTARVMTEEWLDGTDADILEIRLDDYHNGYQQVMLIT